MVIFHLGILNQKNLNMYSALIKSNMNMYYDLIKSNMNDVRHPIPKRWSSGFMAALSKWLIDMGKISTPSNFLFVDFLNIKMENRFLDEVIACILNLGNIVPSNSLMYIL